MCRTQKVIFEFGGLTPKMGARPPKFAKFYVDIVELHRTAKELSLYLQTVWSY